jgi:hypothetical protein
MNAVKHGAYSTDVLAIRRGPFAEDPGEFDAYVTELMESLAPRDALEDEEAKRIALLYVRLRRVTRYEAEILSEPSREDHHISLEAPEGVLEGLVAKARAHALWIAGRGEVGVDFDDLLDQLTRHHAATRFVFQSCPEEPPENLELPARERVDWFMETLFAGRGDALQWAVELRERQEALLMRRDATPARRARAALKDEDYVSVVHQRIARDLEPAHRSISSCSSDPSKIWVENRSRETNLPRRLAA